MTDTLLGLVQILGLLLLLFLYYAWPLVLMLLLMMVMHGLHQLFTGRWPAP